MDLLSFNALVVCRSGGKAIVSSQLKFEWSPSRVKASAMAACAAGKLGASRL